MTLIWVLVAAGVIKLALAIYFYVRVQLIKRQVNQLQAEIKEARESTIRWIVTTDQALRDREDKTNSVADALIYAVQLLSERDVTLSERITRMDDDHRERELLVSLPEDRLFNV